VDGAILWVVSAGDKVVEAQPLQAGSPQKTHGEDEEQSETTLHPGQETSTSWKREKKEGRKRVRR